MEISPDITAFPWPVEDEAKSNLVDSFLLAGVFGHDSTQQVVEHLTSAKDELLAHEKELLAADILVLEEETAKAQEKAESSVAETETLRSESKALRDRVREVGRELEDLLSERSRYLRLLLSKRVMYPLRLLQKKQEALAELAKKETSRLLEDENNRLEYERSLHKRALELRSLTKGDCERQVAFLDEQRRVVVDQFSKLDKYLENLRFLGLTRTTAGFMVWAGYISFTAFGWFAGDIVQKLLGPAKEALPAFQQIVEMLAGVLQAAISKLGVIWTAILMLVGPVVPLVIAGILFYLVDRLMSRFDSQWVGGRTKKKERGKESFSPWPQATRITRGDYSQAIGRLPFLYVWMMAPLLVAFLFTYSGKSAGNTPIALPSLFQQADSFVFAFLGVVLCIMVASFAMLYSMRVIEPRFRRLISADTAIGAREAIRLNIEIISLLGLLLLTIIGPDLVGVFLPAQSSGFHVTAGLWTLLFLNGLTVSYGLIYRGHFRDHAVLRKQMESYAAEIEQYSVFPLVDFNQEDVRRFPDRMASLELDVEVIWRTRRFFESPLSRGASIFGRWWSRRRSPSLADTDVILVSVTNADEFLEPEIVGDIGQANRKVDSLKSETQVLDGKLKEIAARLIELASENHEAVLRALQDQKRHRKQQYFTRVSEISGSFVTLITRCQGAARMGVMLRDKMLPAS